MDMVVASRIEELNTQQLLLAFRANTVTATSSTQSPISQRIPIPDMTSEEDIFEDEKQTDNDHRHDSATHLDPSTTDDEDRDITTIRTAPAFMEDPPDTSIPIHFDPRVRLLRRDDDSRCNAMMRSIQQLWQDLLRVKQMSAFVAACKVPEERQPGMLPRPPFIAVMAPEQDLHKVLRAHDKIVSILR
ncbi:hypothetical protein AC578_3520 [Pseudocercospora eumusae]|uniref:Uncharacterized protein n=1 Tax=Pseudocercospora eumusae TaxID=321146 RepID=A0A139H9H9_9PEZI|nr:hypothetical protein AC578_3520 [Pseudocercospora eumusae]